MAAKKTKTENSDTERGLTIFEKFLGLTTKYKSWEIIKTSILFIFVSFSTYIALNPEYAFDKYLNYIQDKHAQSTKYRMETSPLIRNYLNQLAYETNADRTYVIEYHNGKSNPTGLQWQYGEMTFINDSSVDDIREEFQDLSLAKYPIFYYLYENNYWEGTIEELQAIDKRLALRVEVNDASYIALSVLYGQDLKEIGVLGITYTDSTKVNNVQLRNILKKYSIAISPLLDETIAEKNYKK